MADAMVNSEGNTAKAEALSDVKGNVNQENINSLGSCPLDCTEKKEMKGLAFHLIRNEAKAPKEIDAKMNEGRNETTNPIFDQLEELKSIIAGVWVNHSKRKSIADKSEAKK